MFPRLASSAECLAECPEARRVAFSAESLEASVVVRRLLPRKPLPNACALVVMCSRRKWFV